jgi:ATP-binding cassette subfamily F protein 3
MLSLSNISLRRGRKVLIENVNLQVHAGQRMGVIGANGSGKSSLFAMLLGELEADDGELGLHPQDEIAHVAQESPRGSGSAIDYVMDGDTELREVQAAIAASEVTEDGTAPHALYERLETIDGFSAEARAARLLHGLGFADNELQQSVDAFSGGWRMRLNLARALMCRSDILLLDEPTNHLDLPAILWLERWLKRYEGILLVVSHDRDFLDQVCTRIAACGTPVAATGDVHAPAKRHQAHSELCGSFSLQGVEGAAGAESSENARTYAEDRPGARRFAVSVSFPRARETTAASLGPDRCRAGLRRQ